MPPDSAWAPTASILINAKGIKARYLRFYSKGSTESAMNEYTEIEVYGCPPAK